MKKTWFVLIMVLSLGASSAFAAVSSKKLIRSSDGFRIYQVTQPDGRKVTLITNVDESGKRIGGELREVKEKKKVTVVRRNARVTRRVVEPEEREQPVFIRPGIPICQDCPPNRPINPFRPVNPFKDPTAIPSSNPPVRAQD